MTCARVRDEDVDTRYVAGTLSQEDSEAFEAHYFGCEDCWSAVQRGLELRATLADAAPPRVSLNAMGRTPDRPPLRKWAPLAAAAGILMVAAVIWQSQRAPVDAVAPAAMRGATDSLQVTSRESDGMLIAAWRPIAGADAYRVLLLTADGVLVAERETADTTARVALEQSDRRAGAFWVVQALDPMREVIARSGPTAARPSAP